MTDSPITPTPNALGLWTPEQLASQLDVTVRTLQRWEVERRGPAVTKVGKKTFYRAETVTAWLESRERPHKGRNR